MAAVETKDTTPAVESKQEEAGSSITKGEKAEAVITPTKSENDFHPLRNQIREKIVKHPLFDNVILVTILVNCIFLGLANPTLDDDDPIVIASDVCRYIYIPPSICFYLSHTIYIEIHICIHVHISRSKCTRNTHTHTHVHALMNTHTSHELIYTSLIYPPPLPVTLYVYLFGFYLHLYIQTAEIFFAIIFTLEMILKFLALGFFGKENKDDPDSFDGYFRSSWNCMDFFIVFAGYIGMLPGIGNISAFRIIRVLRPLRTINRLPGLKLIVNTLLISLKSLGSVAGLLGFLMVIFAITGLQLWSGLLHNQCYDDTDLNNTAGEDLRHCGAGDAPGGYECPEGFTCQSTGVNMWEGLVSFDNLPNALLTLYFASSGIHIHTSTSLFSLSLSLSLGTQHYL